MHLHSCHRCILLPILMSFSFFCNAQTKEGVSASSPDLCAQKQEQACIALVLGGGGARGGAHIGVIRALEEVGIQPDLVVGTSIGSFVGGLYASGKSAAEIEMIFNATDWNAGYKDALSRQHIPNRRKRQLDAFPIHLDLGLDSKGLHLPKGFIQGQSMEKLIDTALGIRKTYKSFDELPIPFRAVAADIETGQEVIIDRGDLATAMQISMSLPGILRPVEYEGRVLVDGGIANNLPVSVAQGLGADYLIVVNIGSPGQTREELGSGFSILRQLSSLLVNKNVEYQQSLMTQNDILITPDMDEMTLLDFDNIQYAIEAGVEAAKKALREHQKTISTLKHATTKTLESKAAGKELDAVTVQSIQLKNSSRLGNDYILHRMNLREGETYTEEKIQEGMDRLYGQGTMARVSTQLESSGEEGAYNLAVNVEEKEWGPGYLDMKFTLEDDFHSFSHFQLGGSHRLTNLSPYGAELVTSIEVGTEKLVHSDFYWPLKSSGVFLAAGGQYEHTVLDYTIGEESYGNVVAKDLSSHAGIGWRSVDRFDVIFNAIYSDTRVDIPAFISDTVGIDKVNAISKGLSIAFNHDSLDHASFPKSGWKLKSQLTRSKDELLNIDGYATRIEIEFNGVYAIDRHSIRNQLRYQSLLNSGEISPLNSFSLGGFLNLSGNAPNFISGQHVRFYSMVYHYEVAENNFGALRLPIYLGFSLEKGNAWFDEDAIDYGDLIGSSSAFIGWTSPLGPAYLAYAISDTNEKSVYLYLGVTF